MNQTPEQIARDHIDRQLTACGWMIQDKSGINLHAAPGVAVREYQTGAAPQEEQVRFDERQAEVLKNAARIFTGTLNEYIYNLRKIHEQKIDLINIDEVENAGWD